MKKCIVMSLPAMKILQINTEQGWSGQEQQTFLAVKGLVRAGIDARLLCLQGTSLAMEAEQRSLPAIPVANHWAAFKYLITSGKDFDLLHAHTNRAQSLAVLGKPLHKRKVVYTRKAGSWPRGLKVRFKYLFTDQVVAVSYAGKRILEKSQASKDILVIPCCIDDTEKYQGLDPKAWELKKSCGSQKIIATASDLVPHKDPLTLVQAVARLKKSATQRFVFLHFGQGRLETAVRQEIQSLGLEREYHLMGFDKNLKSLFPVFDLFVMSSREESLSSAVLEAFQFGVPVVATAAGGLEELVEGRGLLCPVRGYLCLARRMNQVLRSPHLYQDLIQNAQDYVYREHSLEGMTREHIRMYQELLP